MVKKVLRFLNGFDYAAVGVIFLVAVIGGLAGGGLVIGTVFLTVGP